MGVAAVAEGGQGSPGEERGVGERETPGEVKRIYLNPTGGYRATDWTGKEGRGSGNCRSPGTRLEAESTGSYDTALNTKYLSARVREDSHVKLRSKWVGAGHRLGTAWRQRTSHLSTSHLSSPITKYESC